MINAKKTHRLEIRIDETELEQFNLKHLALQEQLWALGRDPDKKTSKSDTVRHLLRFFIKRAEPHWLLGVRTEDVVDMPTCADLSQVN